MVRRRAATSAYPTATLSLLTLAAGRRSKFVVAGLAARFTPPAIISRDGSTAVLVTPFATADDVKVSDSTKALRAIGRRPPERTDGAGDRSRGGADRPQLGVQRGRREAARRDRAARAAAPGPDLPPPVFWIIPLFTVLVTEGATRGVGYLLARTGLTFDAASTGIQSVLVFGAATDYALLLVARYREE